MKFLQRLEYGSHQVRAASHGLGQNDVRPRLGDEFVRSRNEVFKPATEAASGDFARGEAEGAEALGIDGSSAWSLVMMPTVCPALT
ncbi:MAG: hypothetical protein MZW92_81630 [Comamonadaceae bacterium]|nr:hypothetical protein [Comamonadaceae bacterium]